MTGKYADTGRRICAAFCISYRCQLIAHFPWPGVYVRSRNGRSQHACACQSGRLSMAVGRPSAAFRCAGKKQFEPRPLESFGAPIGFALNEICPANARAMCRFPFQMRKFYPFLFFVCFDDNLFIQHAVFARKTTNFGGKIKGKAGDLWGHFMRQIYDIVID